MTIHIYIYICIHIFQSVSQYSGERQLDWSTGKSPPPSLDKINLKKKRDHKNRNSAITGLGRSGLCQDQGLPGSMPEINKPSRVLLFWYLRGRPPFNVEERARRRQGVSFFPQHWRGGGRTSTLYIFLNNFVEGGSVQNRHTRVPVRTCMHTHIHRHSDMQIDR